MSDVKRSDACWAVSDGRAGNARQAAALAAALRPAAWDAVELAPRAPWRWCAPRRLPGDRAAFGPGFAGRLQAPPAIAIGCGRQAALATRLLRARGSQAVQILDPRLDPRHWDLVVVPEHDALRGGNVLTLLGSLHPVDDAWLAAGRAAFPALGALPGPRVALLVGGPTRQVPWTVADLAALLDTLHALLRAGGSVLATISRRTPPDVALALQARLRDLPGVLWRNEDDGPNPYPGLLGWADAIACTADSSNLLSEACATKAPVAVAFAGRAQGRLRNLIEALQARDRLAPLETLLDTGERIPLRETARIAALVRERLLG
ncbi:nucleoside-diphosphate sugar epimerase [[Pseudomonas] boreopolis]|uniref:Nucleoside-diphosphate sugar epimerase n=1 Tax=Xanthomonas boreopolis TaxID=86183 RepID=A0A919KI02_9XANT|nr:nucleoside-diphosphate sugar epimerase [[Pseudomonas] boreopolis]